MSCPKNVIHLFQLYIYFLLSHELKITLKAHLSNTLQYSLLVLSSATIILIPVSGLENITRLSHSN